MSTTPERPMRAGGQCSGAGAFDFLLGHWRVSHRRLRRRLQGCTDWDTFDGTTQVWPVLDGLGNVDDNVLHLPEGQYRAVSLRAFDAAADQWAIWWLDGRTPSHIDVPVRGRFAAGVGTFLADDVFEGRPIRVRFVWSKTSSSSPQWAQAFSADGGVTWETNWTMHFTRPMD